MIGNIGPLEIGIVLVFALLLFGPRRLPELGNGLGRGMREFKESVTGENKDEATLESPAAIETAGTITPSLEPPATHRVEVEPAEVVRARKA